MPEARDLHPLRLLAISGSLRRASTNTAVLEALADLAPDDVEVTIYRGLAELPAFNADDDEYDPPEPVRAFATSLPPRWAFSSPRRSMPMACPEP